MALFSFVIPVYNTSRYLKQCLDSVLAQSYTDFEAIIVNDGSTDDSPFICEGYSKVDHRLKVVHKKNGGLVSARIAGVSEVSGEYVICLDSDDWIKPDYLETIASCIFSEGHPDIICMGYIKAVGGRCQSVPLPFEIGYYGRERIEQNLIPSLLRGKDDSCFPGQLWAKAFKVSLYKQQQQQCGLFLKIGEDKACTIVCVDKAESIVGIDYCGYYYRMNPTSMTKEGKPFPWNGPQQIGEHLEKYLDLKKNDYEQQLARFVTHEVAIVAASQFFMKKSYKEIRSNIREHLNNPYYLQAIGKAHFESNILAIAMHYVLKKRLYLFLFLYNKIFQSK